MHAVRLAVGLLLTLAICVSSTAQESFELVVPGEAVKSTAELTEAALTITDAQRRVFRYARAPQHDSPDGSFLGFANADLNQIIRWPANGRGWMQIGERDAGQVVFRESRMRLQRVDLPAARANPGAGLGDAAGRPTSRSAPMSVATAMLGDDRLFGGYVGQEGLLHIAAEQNGEWDLRTLADNTHLPPGAPLVLVDDPDSPLPRALLIDEDGRLTSISTTGRVQKLTPPRYRRRSHLASAVRSGVTLLFSVDRDGHLLEIPLDMAARGEVIEPTAGELVPGCALAAAGGDEVLLVDAQGVLRRYLFDAGWFRADPRDALGQPLPVAAAPGSWLAATRAVPRGSTIPTTHVVMADSTGRIQILHETAAPEIWDHHTPADAWLNPGAPVALSAVPDGLIVSAIAADGGWQAWHARRADGDWARSLITRGMQPFGPLAFPPLGPYGFAIDVRGNLLAARYAPAGPWSTHLCAPRFVRAPRLVSREIIANPPLPPAKVQLTNRHERELWVLIANLRDPKATIRLKIRPGESKSIDLARDSGGEIIETFVFPGALGTAVQQQTFPVPPETLYDISVYELFLQSVAIDRTKRGAGKIEDVNWSPKSIGVFPLPPGDSLRDGEVIDVFDAARQEQNPGAVRQLDLEQWKGEEVRRR